MHGAWRNNVRGSKGQPAAYYQRLMEIQPSHMIGFLPLWEASGAVAEAIVAVDTGNRNNLVQNGGFETAGTPVFYYWSSYVPNGSIVDETVIVHSGSHSCKIVQGASGLTTLYRNIAPCAVGQTYELRFWTRGDGTNAGRYAFYNATTTANIGSIVSTGISGTDWAEVVAQVVIPDGCANVGIRLYPANVVGAEVYLDDVTFKRADTEVLAAAGRNGAYTSVTLGQAGFDGNICPAYDGSVSACSINTHDWRDILNRDEGTLSIWFRITDDAIWTDGISRNLINIGQDGNNLIQVYRTTANNAITSTRIVSGSGRGNALSRQIHGMFGWNNLVLSWSVSNNRVRNRINGLLLADVSTIPAWQDGWVGGVAWLGQAGWPGLVQHVALWDVELTPAETLAVSQPFGTRMYVSVFGDSLACTGLAWPAMLWSQFHGGSRMIVNNRALGGSKFITQAGAGNDFLDQVVAAASDPCDVGLVMLGTNDSDVSGAPQDAIAAAMTAGANQFASDHPGATLHFLNVPPRDGGAALIRRATIAATAAALGWPCWNTYDPPVWLDEDLIDHLHPNDTAGNPKMADFVESIL